MTAQMQHPSRAVEQLKTEIARDLASSARAYYRIGITEYLSTHQRNWENYQAAVGNLAVSIELMLKAFVARVCFRKLFVGLPDELDVLLTHDSPPPNTVTIRKFETSLRAFEHKTIELDQVISIYCIYFPEKKIELRSYFAFIASTRNTSVHGALPEFQRYDLARVAYLAAKLAQHLREHGVEYDPLSLRKKTDDIIKRFDHERVERVTKQMKAAREASKKLTGESPPAIIDPSNFTTYGAHCPICASGVRMMGYTEPERLPDEDGSIPALLFYPSSFHCKECGLQIDDPRDFSLVGFAATFDRSDDYDEWVLAHADSYDPY